MNAPATRPLAANGIRAFLSGKKLEESAIYLKSARLALLNWVKEAYAQDGDVDENTIDIIEVLSASEQLEDLRLRMAAKASKFGA
jgi:hypothetical protein